MITETDAELSDGRTRHVYETAADSPDGADSRLTVFWHHGTPNIGAPPCVALEPGPTDVGGQLVGSGDIGLMS